VGEEIAAELHRQHQEAGLKRGNVPGRPAGPAVPAEEIAEWSTPDVPLGARPLLPGGKGREEMPIAEREERERRDMIWHELRMRGYSYHAIGERYGVSAKTVHDGVMRMIDTASKNKGTERGIAHSRLEMEFREAYKIMENPGPLISTTGKVVRDDDGNPVEDKKVKLAALGEMRMIGKEERSMLGLDEQKKSIIELREEHDIDARLKITVQNLSEHGLVTPQMLALMGIEDGSIVEAEVVEDTGQGAQS
jgi:hypothetical protein